MTPGRKTHGRTQAGPTRGRVSPWMSIAGLCLCRPDRPLLISTDQIGLEITCSQIAFSHSMHRQASGSGISSLYATTFGTAIYPRPPHWCKCGETERWSMRWRKSPKSGHVWVFDRESGKPLFPFEEREVPPSDVDGETLADKQVLPLLPKPFARQHLTEDMLTQRTPEAHQAALARFRTVRSGDQFAPPSLQGTIVFPASTEAVSGVARPGIPKPVFSTSIRTRWLGFCGLCRVAPPRVAIPGAASIRVTAPVAIELTGRAHRPSSLRLRPSAQTRTREQVDEVVRKGAGRMPGFARLGDGAVNAMVRFIMTGEDLPVSGAEHTSMAKISPLKYGIDGYNKFLDPEGYPAIAPPWGTLNAINLNSGEYAWKIPFGEFPTSQQKASPEPARRTMVGLL